MLMTETNTRSVERKIRAAFRNSQQGYRFGLHGESRPKMARHRRIQTDFEHGQWWVIDLDTGAQWSVCDATPGPFCFEQVTQGEETEAE
jgi:hypothetical protein